VRIDDSGDSWSATTNFEQFRHHELLEMMTGHDAATVLHVGQTLSAASTHIQTLADDLATHINGLQWEGEAADNFKTWARQVVQATDTLSIYTSNTAVAINMAGETLSSTQLPPVPAQQATVDAYVKQFGAKYTTGADGAPRVTQPTSLDIANDPAKQPVVGSNLISHQDAYNAQVVVEAAHQDAIGQMEKLGGSYVGATQTLGVSTVPEFPPAPATLMPKAGQGIQVTDTGTTRAGGTSGSDGVYGGSVSTYKSTSGTKSSSSSSSSEESSGSKSFVSPDSPSTSSGSTSGGTGTSSGGTTTIQGVSGPSTNGGSGGGSTGTNSGGGGTSGGSGPGGVVVTPVSGGSSGGSTGSGGSGSGDIGGAGGTGISGTTTGSKGGASGESESGIHGGVPAAEEALARTGSGNVIGAGAKESGTASAFARSRGIGGSASYGGGAGGEYATGAAGGLAASGGTTAESSSGSSTARSGLEPAAAGGEATGAAAHGSESGMMPMGGGGMGGAGGRGGRKRGRAAYLVEDEETWTQGDAEANPSVIQ
jgi:uncharacterized protein YukE